MPNVNSFGQHLTQGRGPFDPPTRSDIAALETEIFTLRAELASAHESVATADRLRRASTVEALEALIGDAIDVENISVDSEFHNGDTLSITIEGIAVDDNGKLIAPEQEFEVEFSVTVSGYMVVKAEDEDAADRIVDSSLAGWVAEVENTEPSEDDGITDVRVQHPDLDYRIRDY